MSESQIADLHLGQPAQPTGEALRSHSKASIYPEYPVALCCQETLRALCEQKLDGRGVPHRPFSTRGLHFLLRGASRMLVKCAG
jgi:hypothetical protein